jgi:hypothetical protein
MEVVDLGASFSKIATNLRNDSAVFHGGIEEKVLNSSRRLFW